MKKIVLGLMMVIGTLGFAWAGDFLDLKEAEIQKPAPAFELTDLEGRQVSLESLKGKTVFLHFWSAQCPYVVRYEERFREFVETFSVEETAIYGIASNVTESAQRIKKESEKRNLNYGILLDPGHQTADLYGAVTTPHIFIINPLGTLVYEGAFDDQGWSEDNPVKEHYAANAMRATLDGQAVVEPLTKTVGCTVKRA